VEAAINYEDSWNPVEYTPKEACRHHCMARQKRRPSSSFSQKIEVWDEGYPGQREKRNRRKNQPEGNSRD
jgi:hypothetical protein